MFIQNGKIGNIGRQSCGLIGGGGGGGSSITGLRLQVTGTDWVGFVENGFDIFDNGVDVGALTRVGYALTNDFTTIIAGEYTTDSDYNQTAIIGTGAESGAYHWNKGAGITINVYAKFSSAINLTKVEVNMHGGYTFPTAFNWFDQDNNALSPLTAPTAWTDAIESGVPGAAADRLRWTF